MDVKNNCNVGYYIFVSSIRLKDGRRIYASSYGKRAFRILIRK